MQHGEVRKRRQEFEKDFKDGLSPKKIAEKYNVEYQTVYKTIGDLMVERKKLFAKKLHEENLKGLTPKQISDKYDLSPTQVYYYLNKFGGTKRRPSEIRKNQVKEIKQLQKQGLNQKQISEKMGVSHQWVNYIINHDKYYGGTNG